MRITNGHFGLTMLAAQQRTNGTASHIMEQMSSGLRIRRPSDDPVASVQLMLLDRDRTLLKQYRDNIAMVGARLQQNETALSGIQQDLMSAKDLLVQAADGSQSSANINAMAGTLRSVLNNVVTAANARDTDGNFMFSGTLTNTPAIARDNAAAAGARYSYAGNTQKQFVTIANGVTEPINVSVDELIDVLNLLDRATEMASDPAVDQNDPATHDALAAALDATSMGIDRMASTIATLGYAQNTLSRFEGKHADLQVSHDQTMATIGGLDYAEAFERLNRYTMVAESSYRVYGRIMQLNPFDILR